MTIYAKQFYFFILQTKIYIYSIIFSLFNPPPPHITLLLKDHFEYGPQHYIYIKIQQEEGQSMT